jgi:hypothetical protein
MTNRFPRVRHALTRSLVMLPLLALAPVAFAGTPINQRDGADPQPADADPAGPPDGFVGKMLHNGCFSIWKAGKLETLKFPAG